MEAAAFCSQLCCFKVSGFCHPAAGFGARAKLLVVQLHRLVRFLDVFLGPVSFLSQESKARILRF